MGAGGPEVAPAPHFEAPDVRFRTSFLAALAEVQAEGRHAELPAGLLADPAEFARYVTALCANAAEPGAVTRYLARLRGAEVEPWPDGFVPQTDLWWVAGGEYLGRLSIRHRLTPHLMQEGGSIGYEVRPAVRRQGHATAMLAAALPLAAALGIERARVDCDAGNAASRRVVERNGGVLDEERGGVCYFWVATS